MALSILNYFYWDIPVSDKKRICLVEKLGRLVFLAVSLLALDMNNPLCSLQEARLPFMIADVVVIATLHHVDQYMRAEKSNSESIAEEVHQDNVIVKEDKIAQKAATRDEQKRTIKQQKATNKNKPAAQHHIQQPSKSKRN
jgi:hypothetical protein